MDPRVLTSQQWVNATYKSVSGFVPCAETGVTGWPTMYALTMGLQHELGISALSESFGDTTLSTMTAFGPVSANTTNVNIKTLVECGLYCKGYSGGAVNGEFASQTQAGLVAWKTDMGFTASGTNNSVSAKEMKTLLTMDAYVLLAGGDADVRSVQRWMNATYISRRDYQIVPCDGYFSRNVQRGLMLAIQYSIGMADGVANGVFGPGTRAGLKSAAATLDIGSADSGTTRFVALFKAALRFNGGVGVDWQASTFTAFTSSAARAFQTFCLLPVTGRADYETWCSLLVSTGDPDRAGKACDCATPLTDARAKAIRAAGYETVGRYITVGSNKSLTAAEIQTIFANGLTLFPIYQEFNDELSRFDPAQGAAQATSAHYNALALGLPRGSIVYFAVDFDATADEVRSNVLPFFQSIAETFEKPLGNFYSIGIYGSRNICSMVCDKGYAISSYVSGMSTGYSGNLGFPLPGNWAFDQVKTLTLASGAPGQIEVDNDIKSGRDLGISSLSTPVDHNEGFFTWLAWIEDRAVDWVAPGTAVNTIQELTAFYLRTYIDDRYNSTKFDLVSGLIDQRFIDYCNDAKGRPSPSSLRDPKTGMLCDLQHLGASLGSVFEYGIDSTRSGLTLADFGGWAGDLITADAECYRAGITDSNAYNYGYSVIGFNPGGGSFDGTDMLADVDAMVVGLAVRADSSLTISSALRTRYASAAAAKRKYEEFVSARFGSTATMASAARGVMTQDKDPEFAVVRAALWRNRTGGVFGPDSRDHAVMFEGMARAFADVVTNVFVS